MPLLADNFLYESKSETATKPAFAFRANVDFLNRCSHKCAGCFVDKSNGYTQRDLEILLDITRQINAAGFLFDELVLGPVDILGSTNYKELLMEPLFQQLMHECKPILAMPTTMLTSDESLLELLDIFRKHYPKTMELEFQIVLFPERVANGDIVYLENLKRKIALLDTADQVVAYALQINLRKLQPGHLHSLYRLAKDEYNTILDFVPSVFRSKDPSVVRKVLDHWNTFLAREITAENRFEVPMPLVDESHGWFNYAAFAFSNGDLYYSPYVFDQVADLSDAFRIEKSRGDFYDLTDLTSFLETSWSRQFAKANDECKSCKYLNSCVSRQVVSYMQTYGMDKCIYPKPVMDLYDGLGDLTYNLYDWSGYSTLDEIERGNWKNHSVSRAKLGLTD